MLKAIQKLTEHRNLLLQKIEELKDPDGMIKIANTLIRARLTQQTFCLMYAIGVLQEDFKDVL